MPAVLVRAEEANVVVVGRVIVLVVYDSGDSRVGADEDAISVFVLLLYTHAAVEVYITMTYICIQ